MSEKRVVLGLLAIGGVYALSNAVSDLETRIFVGDIALENKNIHLTNINLDLAMPVKNATNMNLSFDGFIGYLDFRGKKIAEISILDTIQLAAGQVVKIPIEVTVWNTTLISEAFNFWEDFLQMIRTQNLNAELSVIGTMYSGPLSFDISKRVF